MKCNLILLLIYLSARLSAQTISVHDPVMIKQDSVYYLFCTGMGISMWSSTNLKDWKDGWPAPV